MRPEAYVFSSNSARVSQKVGHPVLNYEKPHMRKVTLLHPGRRERMIGFQETITCKIGY